MSNTVKIAALSAAIVIGGLGMAVAKEGGKRPQIDFESLDTDGDGLVTQAELDARGAARFAEADTDGDGALSSDELLARSQRANEDRIKRMMERLDANEDGKLTQDEMAKARRGGGDSSRMIKRIDADGDGAISKEEFETAQANFRDRKGKRKGKNKEASE